MNQGSGQNSRGSGLRKASGVISTLLARKGYAHVQTANELETVWREVAGETMAGMSRANQVKAGTLEITVGNSSALHELTFQQQQLLKEMQARLPDQTITNLRFRVGSVES